jgi:hypothetical protein
VVNTSFVGYLPRDGGSMFDYTVMPLFPMIVFISLEGVLGE